MSSRAKRESEEIGFEEIKKSIENKIKIINSYQPKHIQLESTLEDKEPLSDDISDDLNTEEQVENYAISNEKLLDNKEAITLDKEPLSDDISDDLNTEEQVENYAISNEKLLDNKEAITLDKEPLSDDISDDLNTEEQVENYAIKYGQTEQKDPN